MKLADPGRIHELGVRMRFTTFVPGIFAGLCVFMSQPMSAADTQKLSAQDKKFIMAAAKGGMMEVHMGKMGEEHGNSSAVKSFSMRIVDDHTKANTELMMLAMQKGVTLPPDGPAMDPPGLTGRSGAAFDKKFDMMAVADHQKTIALFEKEASSGSDPDVKMWAMNTLPTLRAHLDAAKGLSSASAK